MGVTRAPYIVAGQASTLIGRRCLFLRYGPVFGFFASCFSGGEFSDARLSNRTIHAVWTDTPIAMPVGQEV